MVFSFFCKNKWFFLANFSFLVPISISIQKCGLLFGDSLSFGEKARRACGAKARTTSECEFLYLQGISFQRRVGPEKHGRFATTFNKEQEEDLVRHCFELDKRFFSLTCKSLRFLRYSYATQDGIHHKFSMVIS